MVFMRCNTWLFAAKTSNVGSANVPLLPNPTIALFRPLGVFGGCVCHCDQVQLCEFEWHIGRTLPKTGRPNQWCHTKTSLHMWFSKLFYCSLFYLFYESSSLRANSISINFSMKIPVRGRFLSYDEATQANNSPFNWDQFHKNIHCWWCQRPPLEDVFFFSCFL